MLLLCLDTSAAASVAVVDTTPQAPRVLARWETADTRSHAEVLTPAVETTLNQAGIAAGELDGILVGTGPGPFTGLRAGLVTARTLGFVWDLPVFGMCSLEAIAHDVASLPEPVRPSEFAVATDARRREVYWATYTVADGENGGPRALASDSPRVGAASELPDLPVYGRGAGLYPDLLAHPVLQAVPGAHDTAPPVEWQPHAASLGLAAAAALAADLELSDDTSPLYLRESDAKVPGPRKKATA